MSPAQANCVYFPRRESIEKGKHPPAISPENWVALSPIQSLGMCLVAM